MATIPAPAVDLATDALLPCPFCGSTNIDPKEWSGNDGKAGPGCNACGALAETAELWNRRANLAAVPASEPTNELSVMLWLYRRLPHGYARPPFVEHAIKAMAKRAGIDVAAFLADRGDSPAAAPAPVSGMPDLASLADAMKSARYVYGKESIALQCLDYLQALINNPLPEFGPVGAFHAGETK